MFGGFAANELAVCINNTKPKVIVSAICVKLPLPPGALPTLFNNNQRYYRNNVQAFFWSSIAAEMIV